jgi:hypothetical protein
MPRPTKLRDRHGVYLETRAVGRAARAVRGIAGEIAEALDDARFPSLESLARVQALLSWTFLGFDREEAAEVAPPLSLPLPSFARILARKTPPERGFLRLRD